MCIYDNTKFLCIYIYSLYNYSLYIHTYTHRIKIFIHYTQQFDPYLDPIFTSGRFSKKYVVIEPSMNKLGLTRISAKHYSYRTFPLKLLPQISWEIFCALKSLPKKGRSYYHPFRQLVSLFLHFHGNVDIKKSFATSGRCPFEEKLIKLFWKTLSSRAKHLSQEGEYYWMAQ